MTRTPLPETRKPLTYAGNCSLCGGRGAFSGSRTDGRDAFACPACGASHAEREQAAAILTLFSRGQNPFLGRFIRQNWGERAILEFAEASRFTVLFEMAGDHHRAAPLEGATPGTMRGAVCCQNLAAMTYPDARFDLVMSFDAMRTVPDVEAAIAEVARVLRPGGAHVFSVPLAFPLPGRSTRAGAENVFGVDLIEMHARHGLHARFLRGEPLSGHLRDNAAVAARKLS